MRGLRTDRGTRSRQGDPESEPVSATRINRDLADAGLSRDERLDDQTRAAPEDSHLGAVSRDDRRGAKLDPRRRPGPSRKKVGRGQVARGARILQVAGGAALQTARAKPAGKESALRDLPGAPGPDTQTRGTPSATRW